MEKLYQEYLTIHTTNIQAGHDPLEVAGILVAHALSIYKTVLSKEDYESIVDTISDSRDLIRTIQLSNYDGVTIQ